MNLLGFNINKFTIKFVIAYLKSGDIDKHTNVQRYMSVCLTSRLDKGIHLINVVVKVTQNWTN